VRVDGFFRAKQDLVMTIKKIGGAGLLSFLLLLYSSCELLGDFGRKQVSHPPLEATEWILARLDGHGLVTQTNITLDFTDEIAGGYAGCNWYGGAYAAISGALSFIEVAQTERLCQDPSGVMAQEAQYLEAFLQVRGYQVVDDRLELKNADDEVLLVYERREELPLDPQDLIDTQWLLESWNGIPPLTGTHFTLAFQDGTASGYAGCRNFEVTYQAEGDDLRVTSLSMTETTASCSPQQWAQEGRYTTALSETRNFRLNGNRLDLLTVGGDVLVFTR